MRDLETLVARAYSSGVSTPDLGDIALELIIVKGTVEEQLAKSKTKDEKTEAKKELKRLEEIEKVIRYLYFVRPPPKASQKENYETYKEKYYVSEEY